MDVISRLLGVPDGDQDQLRSWSDALLHRDEGDMDVTPGRDRRRVPALQILLRVRSRAPRRGRFRGRSRGCPRCGRERRRAAHRRSGRRVLLPVDHRRQRDHDEAARQLPARDAALPGRAVQGGGRPDAHRRCRSRRSCGYDGSTQVMARTLTRPVELHGQTMPEGDKVLLLLGSGQPRRAGLRPPRRVRHRSRVA